MKNESTVKDILIRPENWYTFLRYFFVKCNNALVSLEVEKNGVKRTMREYTKLRNISQDYESEKRINIALEDSLGTTSEHNIDKVRSIYFDDFPANDFDTLKIASSDGRSIYLKIYSPSS